jgi:aspartate-semialdehyde dehydrogenase
VPTIGLAGATGALGKEILAVLDQAKWRPDRVIALASPRSEVPTVEYGPDSLQVDDLAGQNMEDLDALILAIPTEAAHEAGERAIGDGVAVVDCSGAFRDDADVPLVVPWVNPEALREPPARGVLSLPGPAALLLASALGPFWRAGLANRVTATVMLPASTEGRGGIDELSRQVVALFNNGNPPKKVFDPGLAFDVLPQVGDAAADGWTDLERVAMAETARLLGMDADIAVTIVRVPVFSGISATIHLDGPADLPLDKLAQLLTEGGLGVAKAGPRNVPRPRKVEGQPFVQVGRMRRDPHGHGLHLWVALDNLRGTAAAAVGCAAILLRAADKLSGPGRGSSVH